MVFSTNQVRHFYVVNEVKGTDATIDGKLEKADGIGTLAVKTISKGTGVDPDKIYFQYRGASGDVRSDLIDVNCIKSIGQISHDAETLTQKLKEVKVTLDPEVNGGQPISGQDYILRICINPYVGMSDEEPYFKYGAVHAIKGMTAADFYAKLAASLYKNFSRELSKMLEFKIANKIVCGVKTKKDGAEVLIDEDGAEITTTAATDITIVEVEDTDWVRGVKEATRVNFEAIPTTVTYDGDEVTWGKVTEEEGTIEIGNGKKIADLEYFCMGERGDIYRNVGWPNVIPTTYLVDPTKKYDIVEIHYYFEDGGEGPQKSERTMTIVSSDTEKITKLIGQLKPVIGEKKFINIES